MATRFPTNGASLPIPADARALLDDLAARLDREQLIWVSGYLAGRAAAQTAAAPSGQSRPAAPAPAPAAQAAPAAAVWTLLYASETGNSRRVAEGLAQRAKAAGLAVKLVDLRDYNPKALRQEKRALIVTATHGLGDPPEGTERFFEYWLGERAPKLEQLKYSVLALGDSSYDEFCETGRAIDARLAALGAERIQERVDCDVDFEAEADVWSTAVVDKAKRLTPATQIPPPAHTPAAVVLPIRPVPSAPQFTREHPFNAEILVNQKITARDSTKDVRHLELSLEGSGLWYRPGDSLGVWPENPPQLIDALLGALKLDGNASVTLAGEQMSLADALRHRLEITILRRAFLDAYAKAIGSDPLNALLADAAAARRYLSEHQVIDLIAEYPGPITAQGLVEALRKLTPRLYSLASSLDANPEEAHLTVAVVKYERFGRPHWGTASSFLSEQPGPARVYVQPNSHFRLPQEPATPIIMVGAGTGIAPYRAFVEQRIHDGANGENWLIFGDRHRHSDFLYQTEWLHHLKAGALHRLDVAFSRDQAEKRYVQHRIAEESARVYDWLERGAQIYVCGEAEHMAPDVHAALVAVVAKHGAKSDEDSEAYLKELKRTGRYQRDVY
jgi:sulfite reductase (NADPH) flavoprotein alpha-component